MSLDQYPVTAPDAAGDGMLQDQTPSAEVPQTEDQINVAFRAMTGVECIFKLKRSTKMGKAMNAFSARQQQDVNTLRFLIDGFRILEWQTPQEAEIEDGDVVDVYQEQLGGGHGDEEPVSNGDELPAGPSAGPKVFSVTFKHISGFELTFRMKASTKVAKATAAFADKMDRKRSTLRFLIDGEPMNDHQSLQDLEIDEDCQVDVMEEQIGGGDTSA